MLIFLLFFAKTKNEKALWAIAIYSFVSVILLFVTTFIASKSRHYLYNLFVLQEYIAFAVFIWYNITKKMFKLLLVVLSIAFALFLIIYTTISEVKLLDSVSIGIESIIILIFCFYSLYELTNEPKLTVFYSDFRFWILLGMIIYLAGSFFVYIFAEQLKPEEWVKYRFLTWVFYSIKAVLFTIGTYVYSRQKRLENSKQKHIPYLDLTL